MKANTRARQRVMKSAPALLPPGAVVRDCAIGRVQARLTKGAVAGAALFILVFAGGLARHTVIIPGGLFIVYMISAIIPPRAVVIADQGIAVLNRSPVHGRPTKLLGLYPFTAVLSSGDGPRRRVFLGLEWITFSPREWSRLGGSFRLHPQPMSS